MSGVKDMSLSEKFQFHSAVGMDRFFARREVKIAATSDALSAFNKRIGNFLVHKSTNSLWRLAEDGKTIVKMFSDSETPLKDELNESV